MLAGESWAAVRRVAIDRTGLRWALLREPTGSDEVSVGSRNTGDAVRLLDRLLVHAPGCAVGPGEAAKLTVPERDFLLATAYRLIWGDKVAGTLRCAECSQPFDFDFQLDALVDSVRDASEDLTLEGAVYTLPGGSRFRLPTAEDEQALIGLTEDEAEHALLERCLVAGDAAADGPAVLAAMDRVGAGVDIDLEAACSECGHRQSVRFQMQDYALGAISADWEGQLETVHRIALAYHWSLSEILALPSSRRRAFIALLDGESIKRPRVSP